MSPFTAATQKEKRVFTNGHNDISDVFSSNLFASSRCSDFNSSRLKATLPPLVHNAIQGLSLHAMFFPTDTPRFPSSASIRLLTVRRSDPRNMVKWREDPFLGSTFNTSSLSLLTQSLTTLALLFVLFPVCCLRCTLVQLGCDMDLLPSVAGGDSAKRPNHSL